MKSLQTAAILAVIGVLTIIAGFIWSTRQPSSSRTESHSASVNDAKSAVQSLAAPGRPGGDYVGSQACGECHQRISNEYHGHPMARSLFPVAEAQEPLEDYVNNISFTAGESEFRVERKGDRVWHHEILKDEQGVIFDQAEEIRYTVGSGAHGRSYLMWRDGGMYMSPISWYANQGWGPSPQPRSFRFYRRVIDECLQCHTGRFAEEPGREDIYPEPVFHEMRIGCERCHGPGKAHIQFRNSTKQSSADPIVNPSRLPKAQQDAICYQCHFSGEHRILRYGVRDSDFRPGQNLSDIWLFFIRGSGTKTEGELTAAVSHALQMESSGCYQKSGGQLGCISCHDAHSLPRKDDMAAYYRQKCLNCHENKPCSQDSLERLSVSANDSCVDCHMPSLNTRGVPHVSQTDHRIPRFAKLPSEPRGDLPLTLYREPGVQIPDTELIRAEGLMLVKEAQHHSNPKIAEESLPLLKKSLLAAPNDERVLDALASAYELLKRPFEEETCLARILENNPRHENSLLRMANLLHDRKRFRESSRYFATAFEGHTWRASVHGRYANVLGQLGDPERALEQAKIAIEIDPTMSPAYHWLAQSYDHLGDHQTAQHFRELGFRLQKKLGASKQ